MNELLKNNKKNIFHEVMYRWNYLIDNSLFISFYLFFFNLISISLCFFIFFLSFFRRTLQGARKIVAQSCKTVQSRRIGKWRMEKQTFSSRETSWSNNGTPSIMSLPRLVEFTGGQMDRADRIVTDHRSCFLSIKLSY